MLTPPHLDMANLGSILRDFETQGIIEPCPNDEFGFYSTLFTRSKRDGSCRVIFNLSKLNDFITPVHFKMDTVKDAILLMSPHCYFASIDFKNAYYSVPIHADCRKYLRFEWEDQSYQFTVFPQGLCSVPRAFTKLMKPPFATLRAQGYTVLGYIDDTLLIESSEDKLNKAVRDATKLFDSLGLTINIAKSVFSPTRIIEYLGFELNSDSMTVSLALRKKQKIRVMGRKILKAGSLPIREMAEFIGNLVAATLGVYRAPLHYKQLEITKNRALSAAKGSYEGIVTLDADSRADIQWWVDTIITATCPVWFPDPAFTITSDASLSGWGAWCGDLSTGGDWSEAERQEHINWLELQGAYLALMTFGSSWSHCHVRVMLDNTTAVACIQKYGSNKPKLLNLTKSIFDWCSQRDIHLSAAHIPGKLNVQADRESRTQNLDGEWCLKQEFFDLICTQLGTPEIDLFASRLNARLDCYVAWRPDPYACFIDAFQMSWCGLNAYAFPPFSVLTQVLQKTRKERPNLILVAPNWPTKPWFPVLKAMSKGEVRLPSNCLYLPQDRTQRHRLERTLSLTAYKL